MAVMEGRVLRVLVRMSPFLRGGRGGRGWELEEFVFSGLSFDCRGTFSSAIAEIIYLGISPGLGFLILRSSFYQHRWW